MGLTEQKKKEWEGTLKDSGLLSLTDKIQDKRGLVGFWLTDKRNVFLYGRKTCICRWSWRLDIF